MYEWKIRTAKNYKELEKLVESIQDEVWTIEKIDMKAIAVVAYRPRKQQLTENEWDFDFGQQPL